MSKPPKRISWFDTRWSYDLSDIEALSLSVEHQMGEARAARARRLDRDIMDAMFGKEAVTANVERPAATLTIDTILKAMQGLPPKQTWISWKAFEGERAWTFEGDREVITIAGPKFWVRVALNDRVRAQREASLSDAMIYGAGTWFEKFAFSVDPRPEDNAQMAQRRLTERDRIVEILRANAEAWLGAEGKAWLETYRRVQP